MHQIENKFVHVHASSKPFVNQNGTLMSRTTNLSNDL